MIDPDRARRLAIQTGDFALHPIGQIRELRQSLTRRFVLRLARGIETSVKLLKRGGGFRGGFTHFFAHAANARMEILQTRHLQPQAFAIMAECAQTLIGAGIDLLDRFLYGRHSMIGEALKFLIGDDQLALRFGQKIHQGR